MLPLPPTHFTSAAFEDGNAHALAVAHGVVVLAAGQGRGRDSRREGAGKRQLTTRAAFRVSKSAHIFSLSP